MSAALPTDFAELRHWATEARITVAEARVRFAQYAVLRGIASYRPLREALVFKGGNALDFVWQPNRSTRDLDFSVDATRLRGTMDRARLAALLADALAISTRALGVSLRVHGVAQQPPGADKTFVTYTARVGYALPDELALRDRLNAGLPSTQVVPLDISLNEPICADEEIAIDTIRRLRVSTVDDIVAEKLRALLQQRLRNRERSQDLLDLAFLIRERPELGLERIAAFLLIKAVAREVPVSRRAFHDPELAVRARRSYALLEQTTRVAFIPFDEALTILWGFTDRLPIAVE